ncbi:MAG: SDR family oxidoreductase [Bdellovibrionia bacterium]
MKVFQSLLGGATVSFFAFQALALRRRISFSDRVVLITGASRGLGFILARDLLKEGAKVVLCARSSKELEAAQKDLEPYGPNLHIYPCDVSHENETNKMIQYVFENFGRLDVLINNASVIQVGPVAAMTKKNFDNIMSINFSGAINTTLAAMPRMEKTGRIINITSIGGAVAIPHLLPYVASKFAMVGFSLGLRAELHQRGIKVVTVLPGLMRTGSFVNALFKGRHTAEFNWFSLGASLPLISMDAERAARKILNAGRRGDAFLTIGLPAKLARVVYSFTPGLGADIFSLINRTLPKSTSKHVETKLGKSIRSPKKRSRLTRLGTRAATKFREV